jgi:hypothetical protein
MTLADVLPIAKQLTPGEKLRLIRILVDELDSADTIPVTLEEGQTYPIFTPLDQYDAAADLLAAFPDIHVPGVTLQPEPPRLQPESPGKVRLNKRDCRSGILGIV